MANLQIKGIEDSLYKKIKELAASENRSVSQQVLFLIKECLSRRGSIKNLKSPAQTLLELAGSWEDNRTAEKIISEVNYPAAELRGIKNQKTVVACVDV
jgi:hypothetical protein